jgi:TolB-like protein/Tfp pilus assembly protein PilF
MPRPTAACWKVETWPAMRSHYAKLEGDLQCRGSWGKAGIRAMSVPRKLAAIFAADVAGYSRLTGLDEEGTLERLRNLRRELINPAVSLYRGRVVKTTGDGILIEFPSVVDALRCALDVQRGMDDRNADVPTEKRIEFRVGINVGDVVVEGEDLLGDSVNVAARLEGIAEPGGICISESAYQQVRDKVDVRFQDAGEQQLKNIPRPVRAYQVRPSGAAASSRPAPPLPDKPSIAVLPFKNMSGDPEQEYFADGIVEEIITALSRFRQLFVIARNSSFTYKGRVVDVKQVGRELGVRYVLEGSVRRSADRVRVTGQLIDAATGAHLWADRFDGALEDIFELQDRVTTSVVGAIAPKLEQAEIDRAKRKPPDNLDAYDYYLRGMASHYHSWSKEAISEALRLYYKAIEIDPDFASAYGAAARCYVERRSNNWVTHRGKETAETARLARRAVELGRDDAIALSGGGFALAQAGHDLDAGAAFIDRALVLNPNLAVAWYYSGFVRVWLGEPDTAIDHIARAMRLSPLDPIMRSFRNATAHAHFCAGRYDQASSWAEMVLQENPDSLPSLRIAAASNALSGRATEASEICTRLRQVDPALRISNLRDRVGPYRRSEDIARLIDGLRKAGVPD